MKIEIEKVEDGYVVTYSRLERKVWFMDKKKVFTDKSKMIIFVEDYFRDKKNHPYVPSN